jgi:hypothetical protein
MATTLTLPGKGERKQIAQLNYGNSFQPQITPVDTFAAPIAPDYNEIRRNSLSNFLQQIVPEFTNYAERENRAKAKIDAQKAAEFDFKTNGLISYAEAREKGLLDVRSDPTVAMAYNEALGAEKGRDIAQAMNEVMFEKRYEIQAMKPSQFSVWYRDEVALKLKDLGEDFLGQTGVTSGINSVLKAHEWNTYQEHERQSREFVQQKRNYTFDNHYNTALEGFNWDSGDELATRINAMNDDLLANDSSVASGRELNEQTARYLKKKIDTATTAEEVASIRDGMEKIKAGSGSLANTSHWKDIQLEMVEAASTRIQSLNARAASAQAAAERKDTDALRTAAYEYLQDNPNADFDQYYEENKDKYPSLQIDDVRSVWNQAKNLQDGPISLSRYQDMANWVASLDPTIAAETVQDVIRGQSGAFTVRNISEVSALDTLLRNRLQFGGTNFYNNPIYQGAADYLRLQMAPQDGIPAHLKPIIKQQEMNFQSRLNSEWLRLVSDNTAVERYWPDWMDDNLKNEMRGKPISAYNRQPELQRSIMNNLVNSLFTQGFPENTVGRFGQDVGLSTGNTNTEKPGSITTSNGTSVTITPD